jgi:hypothetical protein
LVVETPQVNLVAGRRWFLSNYTVRFNARLKRFGHVFSGRYKALIVDCSGNGYPLTACDGDLKRLGWEEADLGQRAKSDPAKLAIAARLRRETTVTLPWIALRLSMGTWKSLNANLHRWRKANAPNDCQRMNRGGFLEYFLGSMGLSAVCRCQNSGNVAHVPR